MDFRVFSALAIDADERLVPSPCPFILTDRRPGTYVTWGKMLCRGRQAGGQVDRQTDRQ